LSTEELERVLRRYPGDLAERAENSHPEASKGPE